MKKKAGLDDAAKALLKASSAAKEETYLLRLYVTGMTPRSQAAILNINALCEKNLKNRYDLQVIDISRQPELAQADQIVAAPTLIKKLPLPIRKFIGDMSKTEKILLGLEIHPVEDNKQEQGGLSQARGSAARNRR